MQPGAPKLPQRRLSAVLFADICGYSRLMSANEEQTRVRVNQAIKLIKSLVGDYGGEVIHVAGDGVLATFVNASQSLKFAVDIQREFHNQTAWASEEEKIVFRIGINLGEITVDETGVQGHHVNVASRVQGLAPPGGTCITDAVRQNARGIDEIKVHSMGRKALKNIPDPIEVFTVEDLGPQKPSQPLPMPPQEIPQVVTKHSIAVLPLQNMSGDPQDSHICDGITADLITSVSRFRDLFVIARNSAFLFRNNEASTKQIGEHLGVRYLATGGLQRAGRKVRIHIQLQDVGNEKIVWSERYDGDLEDIFEFQDEVTSMIASRLSIEINIAENQKLASIARTDIQAYGLILRGDELNIHVAREANTMARHLFEQAAEIDPINARSYAGMSRNHSRAWRFNWTHPPEPELETAVSLAQKAVEIDCSDSRGYAALGSACLYKRQHEESLASYERAIELNPNDADVLAEMGHAVCCYGETERAVTFLKRAMRLNPYYPDWYLWHLGEAYFDLGDYNSAVGTLGRMHDKAEGLRMLTASHALLGNISEARGYAKELLRSQPEFTLAHWKDVPPDRNPEPRERLLEGLAKAGLK